MKLNKLSYESWSMWFSRKTDSYLEKLWRPWCRLMGHRWMRKLQGQVCERCRYYEGN